VLSEISRTFIVVIASVKEDESGGQGLTSKENRMGYSTELRKMTSTSLLKRGQKVGIAVYVPKATILKEMAAKIA
jgi:hypothetical protein